MKICYISGQYPLVSLTFIQREIEALRTLGLDVITCSMRRTPPEQHLGSAEKDAAHTTFYVLENLKRPVKLLAAQRYLFSRPKRYLAALRLAMTTRSPGIRATFYQAVYFLEATVLARHLQAEGVTHLHNHFTTGSATVAMLASELTGIPYSFTLHGPADFLEPYRWRLDAKAARARFVAVISHYARSQLMFFSEPQHWDRFHIIHCGVDPARYAPAETTKGETCNLIFVGRFAPVKGLRLLIEAMAQLAEELPELRLVLVGDGPDRQTIEDAAKPLGDKVRFTGYLSQDDVADALQAADIAVLPSFAEGVPVFLMEAFANRKPVIATRVAGVSELVEDGASGLLVPPGDIDSLVMAIRQLATAGPEQRKAMGTLGRAKVEDDFDIHVEAARLAHLFTHGSGPIRPEPLTDRLGESDIHG